MGSPITGAASVQHRIDYPGAHLTNNRIDQTVDLLRPAFEARHHRPLGTLFKPIPAGRGGVWQSSAGLHCSNSSVLSAGAFLLAGRFPTRRPVLTPFTLIS